MRIKAYIVNSKIRRPLLLLAAHHARQTLRRLREVLPRITMTLSQVNASADGLDKRCVVELKAGKSNAVVMASTARTWQEAIKLALRQASERLTALSRSDASDTRGGQPLLGAPRPLLRRG